jgi:hypothetical protein
LWDSGGYTKELDGSPGTLVKGVNKFRITFLSTDLLWTLGEKRFRPGSGKNLDESVAFFFCAYLSSILAFVEQTVPAWS